MFKAALSQAPARRFFAAHAQSCLGSGLAVVALPLLAYERFGTAWAVTAVLLPELLPAILLGPLLGALVDRTGWRTCAVVADILRCAAFALVMTAHSMPVMFAGALMAGMGTALFAPAAMAGLPRLVDGDEPRAAVMGLFGAIDDLGFTAGPALAAVGLAFMSPEALIGFNVVSFACSAVILATIRTRCGAVNIRTSSTLFADARAGVRDIAGRPEIRTLLASSSGVVLCIGITNIGEVVLAREVLGVGGSGLAAMVAAGGLGTILGSLCTRLTTAGAWVWRRAYTLGLFVMSVELFACAFLHSYVLVLLALALGGFGNGLALVHDRMLLSHSTPESLHGRVFGLQKTCVSFAFALSFLASGALIASVGVQAAFFACAVGLTLVQLFVLPRLRRAWPTPNPGFGRASLGAHGEIAQLVEHTTENRGVPGSSPGLAISASRSAEPGTTARQSLATGSSPGLAISASRSAEPGTTARQSLATGSSPGLAISASRRPNRGPPLGRASLLVRVRVYAISASRSARTGDHRSAEPRYCRSSPPTARQSLATGSSPGLAISDDPPFQLTFAEPAPRLVSATRYALEASVLDPSAGVTR